MLLSGKLKPATVSVPLEVGPPLPVLPHAVATKTKAARAARNLLEPILRFIELFSLPPLGLPIQPAVWPDSSIYAVLKVAARPAAAACDEGGQGRRGHHLHCRGPDAGHDEGHRQG